MTSDDNRRVVERFDALFGKADLRELDELCTPDMVNHALAAHMPKGLAGTRKFLEGQAHSFTSDGWAQVTVIAERDYVVQHGIRSGRWKGGPLFGFELRAGEYSRECVFIYRLENGRIAERWAVRDDMAMIRQLGGLPSAPKP